MHHSLIITRIVLLTSLAPGQMILNDAIGNDPAKESLCALRAKHALGSFNAVPFEIDSGYIARMRSLNPDATFVAMDGITPQLIECYLSPATGRYEPVFFSPEQSFWHLIKPKQFEPAINTPVGTSMAGNACLKAAATQINRPNFDHSVYSTVVEVELGRPKYHPRAVIAGKSAERFDVAVEGMYFYRSSGPDLEAIKFTCLFSPMLELKAVRPK